MDKRRRGKAKAKTKAKAKSKTDGVNNQTTLPIEFRDKTLYLCGVEMDLSFASRIKIHAIDLVELFTSSSSSSSSRPSKCRVVSFLGPKDLRAGSDGVPCGACGVSGGSKIVFAGERYRNPECPLLDTYAFSLHDPNKEIRILPGKLNVRKVEPFMAVVAGDLYITGIQFRHSFEVFDSNADTWSALPDYPMITKI